MVIQVTLSLVVKGKAAKNCFFYVCGSSESLGRWDFSKALKLRKERNFSLDGRLVGSFIGNTIKESSTFKEVWTVDFSLPAGSLCEYKYIFCAGEGSDKQLKWEVRPNRRLQTASTKLALEDTWEEVNPELETKREAEARLAFVEAEMKKIEEERKRLAEVRKKRAQETEKKSEEEKKKERQKLTGEKKKELEEQAKKQEEENRLKQEETKRKEEKRKKKMEEEMEEKRKQEEGRMTEPERRREEQRRKREEEKRKRQEEEAEREKIEEEERKKKTADRLAKREARKQERDRKATVEEQRNKEFWDKIKVLTQQAEEQKLQIERAEKEKAEKVERERRKEEEFLEYLMLETGIYLGLQGERKVPDVEFPVPVRLGTDKIFLPPDNKPAHVFLKHFFKKQGRLTTEAALQIIQQTTALFKQEPNLIELDAPAVVFGDTHGQFYDLLHLFDLTGQIDNRKFVFLGDYVDRGSFSTEIVLYLYALKLNYPDNVYLLRGNHECRYITQEYNFKRECIYKYGNEVYDKFMESFDCLPLAVLVRAEEFFETQPGYFLCVHAGIGPDISTLDDIRKINRFQEVPLAGPLCDLLWSDPLEELPGNTDEDMAEIYFYPNLTRGCSYMYGYPAVSDFLKNNNLVCIVRSHEVQKFGYQEHRMKHNDLKYAPVITIFSAPNYIGKYENYASMMHISKTDFVFQPSHWSTFPYTLPHFSNAISYTFPYVLENVNKFLLDMVFSLDVDDAFEEGKENLRRKTLMAARVNRMLRVMLEMKSQREKREAEVTPFASTILDSEPAVKTNPPPDGLSEEDKKSPRMIHNDVTESLFEKARLEDYNKENLLAAKNPISISASEPFVSHVRRSPSVSPASSVVFTFPSPSTPTLPFPSATTITTATTTTTTTTLTKTDSTTKSGEEVN